MRITKIKIKNLFGIKEYEAGSESVELEGKNGTGKTSVIDAIRLALTNRSDREYIVRNGETEGEILIETDNSLRINRKIRTNQADYKSVKQDGREVGSPESFLRDIFTPLQLSPVEFMQMDKKQQNAVILDMIEYDWNLSTIRDWFGEIPSWVSYDQNILQVLNDIQSEKGEYFQLRQDINRDVRNKRAFIEEIGASLPEQYNAERWEREDLSELYRKIETIRKENETIEKAKLVLESRGNTLRKYEAEREIAKAALEREYSLKEQQIGKELDALAARIEALETERSGLAEKKVDKLAVIEKNYEAAVAKYDAELTGYQTYADREPQDFSDLQEEARNVEKMKSHVREYRRMQGLQKEVETLTEQASDLTRKIEKARELPGEILQTARIPIQGLTVKDGIPLINGLPISNLSDGEKLELCIDVAIQKPNGLKIILIDGVEKLASGMRQKLYDKCRGKGLQFIATRTTDDNEMTVVQL